MTDETGIQVIVSCKQCARFMLKGVRPQDTQDAIGGAVLRVYENFSQYDTARPLAPWVRSVARNYFTTWLRDYHTRRRTEVPMAQSTLTDTAGYPYDAIDKTLELDDLDRHVMEQVKEYGIGGAAEKMGVTPRTIMRRIERMRHD